MTNQRPCRVLSLKQLRSVATRGHIVAEGPEHCDRPFHLGDDDLVSLDVFWIVSVR